MVIWNEEECYGFMVNLIEEIKRQLNDKEVEEVYGEDLEEALKEANEIFENETYPHIYKMWYNPMGAFIFTKLVEEN